MPSVENPSRSRELRQLALRVADSLPSDPTEARKVLALARQLVDEFLTADAEAEIMLLPEPPSG
jgi:hypothetical protein